MKIIHISYSYDFTDGGITTVVKQIIKEQKKANLSVEWLASNQFSNPLRVEDFIKKIYEANPSIIHLHGLWRLHTRITSNFIQRGTPYIIAPHGMLDKWALQQSSLKKKLSWNIWEKKALDNCSFIHALCNSEVKSINKINSLWKIYDITNGINLPPKRNTSAKKIAKRWNKKIPNDVEILLFMGRFHKKKGINELVSAWEKISDLECSKNWWLCFVGCGDFEILKNKDFNDSKKRINISKPAFDLEKDEILRSASAFVLSSFSEGLPMAVLEAMSYGIPCLISENCNLPEVLEIGAAIKTNPSVNEIADSLKTLFQMDIEKRNMMTRKAYKYISENHCWSSLTSRIKDLYNSISKDE